MKPILFYIIPLVIYAVINNLIEDLSWPYFLVLLFSFMAYQLARLRYPKDAIPATAKIAQAAFYALTIAIIFRDQFLSPSIVNILLGITFGLVIIDIVTSKKEPSS